MDTKDIKSLFRPGKIIGLLIGLGALIYKVISFFMNMRTILDWWGRSFGLYIALYITSTVTICFAINYDKITRISSVVMMIVSICLLFADGIVWIGFIATMNNRTMTEMGIMPMVNLLNLIANAFVLVGSKGFGTMENKGGRT